MNQREARSSVKALYAQAAAVAGLGVSLDSTARLLDYVAPGFRLVEGKRRPEATANLLRLMAGALESAQERGDSILNEEDADAGHDKVCPVYPFGKSRGR